MLELLQNEWVGYVIGGFLANGFITQAVAITPTKKDDQAVSIIGAVVKTLLGTHGLTRK